MSSSSNRNFTALSHSREDSGLLTNSYIHRRYHESAHMSCHISVDSLSITCAINLGVSEPTLYSCKLMTSTAQACGLLLFVYENANR